MPLWISVFSYLNVLLFTHVLGLSQYYVYTSLNVMHLCFYNSFVVGTLQMPDDDDD